MNPLTTAPDEPPPTLKGPAAPPPRESRLPVVFAVLLVIALLELMTRRITLFPGWLRWGLGIAVLIPILLVALAPVPERWLKVERWVTYVFCAATMVGTIANLANLLSIMINRSQPVTGLQLLASSIGVWLVNVLGFSLLYWQVDRGGPGLRGAEGGPRADWLFPQSGAPAEDVPPGWRPMYTDYFFLAFWTATAFSPTDALPLTSRAKLMMMTESAISLATIIVVASRAINILG